MNGMQDLDTLRRQNLALARGLYSAFTSHDIAAILETLHDEVDWLFFGPEEIPFAGHYLGREAVAGFFRVAVSSTEFLEFEALDFICGGHTVLVQGHERMRARSTGKIWETDWAHVFTVRHGKIIKLREYYDTAVVAAAFRQER